MAVPTYFAGWTNVGKATHWRRHTGQSCRHVEEPTLRHHVSDEGRLSLSLLTFSFQFSFLPNNNHILFSKLINNLNTQHSFLSYCRRLSSKTSNKLDRFSSKIQYLQKLFSRSASIRVSTHFFTMLRNYLIFNVYGFGFFLEIF